MIESFVIKGLFAGLVVAQIAGVMGCFVVWRRMAYFGDSLAHSALLGIALGVALGISNNLAVMFVCSVFAILLTWLQRKKILATDTLLGILAHAALSIGMVTISMLDQKLDLHAYLFGDILTITNEELWWLGIGGSIVLIALFLNWSSLVLMTIHEDLAMAENVRVFASQMLLMFLMTLVVAVSIRVVGILLIASMLVIAPAAARQLAHSPESMAFIACILGSVSVIAGIYFSFHFDTPSGPSIVATLAVLFIFIFSLSNILIKRR